MVLRGDFAGAWKMHPLFMCDCPGWMVLCAEIHTEKRNEESLEMGVSSVCRTDSILCVPNGKVFSGRCSDELLRMEAWDTGCGR